MAAPYFFDELGFLQGGRLTDLSYQSLRLWPKELDAEIVALGQFVQLPTGQHVLVEEDFLSSHLPYKRATFGGLDSDDEPWVFMIQAVPRSVVRAAHGPDANPFDVMRDAMRNALTYNTGAHVGPEGEWTRDDLTAIYRPRGVQPPDIARWSTFELIRGLVAELTGVELADIVAGYPICPFPGTPHECQQDVFDDAFVAWTERRTRSSE